MSSQSDGGCGWRRISAKNVYLHG